MTYLKGKKILIHSKNGTEVLNLCYLPSTYSQVGIYDIRKLKIQQLAVSFYDPDLQFVITVTYFFFASSVLLK